MYQITRVSHERLEIVMSGRLDAEQMRRALDDLVSEAEGIEHGQLLYIVADFHLPTLEAIAIEFSRLPAMLGWIKHFDRAAVLTDKRWIGKVSEFEGRLIPRLTIKAFAREQRHEAEAWLSGA